MPFRMEELIHVSLETAHIYLKLFARLVGYDPDTTQSARVPIASGYIKTKIEGNFILLLINEAPYLAHSPTTLLSEYQIREYGKVIDSCVETHVVSLDPRLMGKQPLEINEEMHIPMEDRGAIMGIPLFSMKKVMTHNTLSMRLHLKQHEYHIVTVTIKYLRICLQL
jgi:hypothetical protein